MPAVAAPGSSRGRRLLLHVALGVLGISVLCCLLVLVLRTPYFFDLRVYRAEGLALRDGRDLTAILPGTGSYATYPPFAAMVFEPLSFLPQQLLFVLWYLLNIALVCYCAYASCRLVRRSARAALVPAMLVAAVALWCEPVYMTLAYGQVNLALLALVLWDFTRPPHARLRGMGVGLAAAFKVTPAIFVVYLLLTRRFRMAATAIGTFVAVLLLSLVLVPRATWLYWTRYLFDVHRVGRLENAVNQTIRGMLVRIDHTRTTPHVQLLLVLVVLVAGMTCAVLAYRVLDEAWGLTACAVTGLLCSPISWSHHWVWCIPLVTLLAFRARLWALPAAAVVFCSFAVWAVPHVNSEELHFDTAQILLSGWYVYLGLAFLALVAIRIRRSVQREE